ncbi:hypothetical protein I553_0726 [Mycobacterium xenopi 4042]|uniref:Uncharacterized protein n=1 Tax=Mycobacterium xenopi 4042 TaxID=1299334 RepID=X7YHB6_MYCXE|nr:hypothetical protein I553_0726 [Mycobacterium xenopi 4042]
MANVFGHRPYLWAGSSPTRVLRDGLDGVSNRNRQWDDDCDGVVDADLRISQRADVAHVIFGGQRRQCMHVTMIAGFV